MVSSGMKDRRFNAPGPGADQDRSKSLVADAVEIGAPLHECGSCAVVPAPRQATKNIENPAGLVEAHRNDDRALFTDSRHSWQQESTKVALVAAARFIGHPHADPRGMPGRVARPTTSPPNSSCISQVAWRGRKTARHRAAERQSIAHAEDAVRLNSAPGGTRQRNG